MKISVISFTSSGYDLGNRIASGLEKDGHSAWKFTKCKYADIANDGRNDGNTVQLTESLGEWTGRQFEDMDAVVFIGALGICVRSIAPYVKSKKTDPAVISIDEKGKFCIPVLSGHIGGANELAVRISEITDSVPVVSTATDVNGKLAVDVLARANGCFIESMEMAKRIAAELVDKKKTGFYSDFPVEGKIPEELVVCDSNGIGDYTEKPSSGICVTYRKNIRPFEHTLYLVPKVLTAGIGCRRNTAQEAIETEYSFVIENNNIFEEAVERAASIDLKKDEAGLIGFASDRNIPFTVYDKDTLEKAEGDFTASEFVKSITGVSNVCERSAVTGSGTVSEGGFVQGRLITEKHARNGVTVALAERKWSLKF